MSKIKCEGLMKKCYLVKKKTRMLLQRGFQPIVLKHLLSSFIFYRIVKVMRLAAAVWYFNPNVYWCQSCFLGSNRIYIYMYVYRSNQKNFKMSLYTSHEKMQRRDLFYMKNNAWNYREFLPNANFITENFITAFFQNYY